MIPVPSGPGASPSMATYVPSAPAPPRTGAAPNWGRALSAGLVVTIACAIVWGLISAVTGYIFGLAGIFLGLAIAYGVRWGAKRVTSGIIVLCIGLTFLAVFLGDVLGLTIALTMAGYQVGFVDVIVHYADIAALAPLDVLLVYVFGLFGAAAGASSLLQAKKAAADRTIYALAPPGPAPPSAPGELPKVEVLVNTMTKAEARITVAMTPPHTVLARVESVLGGASVELDGTLFQKSRILGPEKIIQVPLDGTPSHLVNVRFYGTVRPHIEFRMDGHLVGAV